MDANTYALNIYMDKEERCEKSLCSFLKEIDERVQEMEDIYFELRRLAYDYDDYDFSYELKEEIESRLNISLKGKQ